ncbi:YdaU family protein [Bosea sp. BK604]|uniref:YdaU family protein n=1 Tax=Bosea sp. BK604 TaxID=2512180 RepID=UPI00104A1167|nr:YdaU family protein [Bosea sp. BK604]TCR63191.1 uncharacterized protein DUF1376 [Bosea sp. BK604]
MSRAWMPLYVADYLADTGHLSAAEHGAYLLLIMHYWQNGALPEEDRRLARIARMSAAEWDDARAALFDLFDENWRHSRIDAELAAAEAVSARAREKAGKRWGRARALSSEVETGSREDNASIQIDRRGEAAADADTHAAAIPQHLPGSCQSQPQSPPETVSDDPVSGRREPKQAREARQAKGRRIAPGWRPAEHNRSDALRLGVPEGLIDPLANRFRDFWTAKPGKDALKLDWDATWRNWCASECERKGWAAPGAATGPPPAGISISPIGDPEAWEAWRIARDGRPLPTDRTGCWTVPTRFPSAATTPASAKGAVNAKPAPA